MSFFALLLALALLGAGSAFAANVVGTSKNDVLRGTAKADKLNGRAGNDRLPGLGGNDILIGGPGNDVLIGGGGNDALRCGPGRDTANADAGDTVAPDCELVKGPMLPSLSVGNVSANEGNRSTDDTRISGDALEAGDLDVSVAFARPPTLRPRRPTTMPLRTES